MIERYDTDYKRKSPKDLRSRWIFLGFLGIILSFILRDENLVEHFYLKMIFSKVRWLYDNTIAHLPFAFIYILVPYILLRIYWNQIRNIRPHSGFMGFIGRSIYTIIASCFGLFFWFMILWGFNYGGIPLDEKLRLDISEINATIIQEETKRRSEFLLKLRNRISENQTSIPEGLIPDNLEDLIRKDLKRVWSELNIGEIKTNARVREIKPSGILLRFGTAGFYFPYSGEGHIDAALHPLQKPFTMAHEMAHAYGITDEGECNFIAYLICASSDNEFIKYSGHLGLWRYLAGAWKRGDKSTYLTFRNQMPRSIRNDLDAINENNLKYPDIMPKLRDMTYDTYLKAQGVEDGIQSYGKIIEWSLNWENNAGEHPLYNKLYN